MNGLYYTHRASATMNYLGEAGAMVDRVLAKREERK
jgi:hypothetical protein